jgi:hypothetical protein
MKRMKCWIVAGIVAAAAGSAWAAGGVLPDGQGTNWSYGDIYGQGTYYLRNWKTANVDLAGATNLPWAGIADTPVDIAGYGITDAYTKVESDAAFAPLAHDQDWSTITNTPDSLAGYGITNAIPDSADFITTNDTPQTKAGLLTLDGGATVGGNFVLKLGAAETIAEGGAVPATAANVKVIGDSAPVTATIADGATEGQVLTIRGTDDTDTVTLTNAAVVPNFMIGLRDVISFTWDGSQWVEIYRRDN